jgi:hypothetical protein
VVVVKYTITLLYNLCFDGVLVGGSYSFLNFPSCIC